MTDPVVETRSWSRQHWCLTILVALAFQVALIFLLEKHSVAVERKAVATPRVQLRRDISFAKFLVSDPTAFVLPHPNGFSGEAWLNHFSPVNFHPADWTEPPRVLPLSIGAPGAHLPELTARNVSSPFETIASVAPAPTVPVIDPIDTTSADSSLKIDGPLARRRMLVPPSLPAIESAELLTNSVVQVLVDAEGKTISAVLLSSGVKLPKQLEADSRAAELAKDARFEPATGTVTVGTMTFDWQTRPPASAVAPTNIP